MKILRQSLAILLLFLLSACQNSGETTRDSNSETLSPHAFDIDNYLTVLSFEQNLESLVNLITTLGTDTDWARSFVTAYEHVQAGNNETAIQILQEIADNTENEIGLRIWAWNGLRELGISSNDKTVYGYIFEVNLGAKEADILVVYNDGRMRFISGELGLPGIFVWEYNDVSLPLNQQGITSLGFAQAALEYAYSVSEHEHTIPSEDAPRLTLLTFNGLYVVDSSYNMSEFWQSSSETLALITQTRNEAVRQTQSAP